MKGGWQTQRLREVLAQLVECVVEPGPDNVALDIALAEAVLVLKATDPGDAPCKEHAWTHHDGWSSCRRCGKRVAAVMSPSPDALARESWDEFS